LGFHSVEFEDFVPPAFWGKRDHLVTKYHCIKP